MDTICGNSIFEKIKGARHAKPAGWSTKETIQTGSIRRCRV